MSEIELDQDYAAAEAPHGFQFGRDLTGPVLNAVEADEFPPASQEAIDGLIWLGYLSEEVELFGHRFAIKTLTRGDRLAVTQITKEYEETLGMADAYQAATVAASLLSIDGMPLAELARGADPRASIRKAFAQVLGWYDPVVEALFESVTALNNRQIAAFLALRSK